MTVVAYNVRTSKTAIILVPVFGKTVLTSLPLPKKLLNK